MLTEYLGVAVIQYHLIHPLAVDKELCYFFCYCTDKLLSTRKITFLPKSPLGNEYWECE